MAARPGPRDLGGGEASGPFRERPVAPRVRCAGSRGRLSTCSVAGSRDSARSGAAYEVRLAAGRMACAGAVRGVHIGSGYQSLQGAQADVSLLQSTFCGADRARDAGTKCHPAPSRRSSGAVVAIRLLAIPMRSLRRRLNSFPAGSRGSASTYVNFPGSFIIASVWPRKERISAVSAGPVVTPAAVPLPAGPTWASCSSEAWSEPAGNSTLSFAKRGSRSVGFFRQAATFT
jgi:hypothetical protein